MSNPVMNQIARLSGEMAELHDLIAKENYDFKQMMLRKESPPDGYWKRKHTYKLQYADCARALQVLMGVAHGSDKSS